MAGGVGGERRDGDRCCTLNLRLRPEVPREVDLALSRHVLFLTYLLKAVTGIGYLALTWSTVVLLGGFITALSKKDFWCLTIISLIQAARIFHDLGDQHVPKFFNLVTQIIRYNSGVVRHRLQHVTESSDDRTLAKAAARVGSIVFAGLVVLPFLVMCYVLASLYVYGGPVACIALATWRTVQRDYGSNSDNGDGSKANLAPALDIFYSLVLLQGVLLLVWLYVDSWSVRHLIGLRRECKLPNTEWCRAALVEFLCDTRARCWRDLSSIHGRKLVDYGVGLLDSASWEDNLSGARLLDELIRQEKRCDVRSLLLPCRPRIQKLIDSLGWTNGDREMRGLAARIVAYLASDLHLSQFPGAIQCISSLLQDETTLQLQAYRYGNQQQGQGRLTHPTPEKQSMILQLTKKEGEIEARRQRKQVKEQDVVQQQQVLGDDSSGGSACNELILQGLAILEKLASDHHNCSDICSSPGLLPKITAPLYSGTFVQDIINTDWVHVVTATFKVLYQLIHAPVETSARLRVQISSNKQAMSNLEAIIHQDTDAEVIGKEAYQELQMRAMELLTELALDLSIRLPRETKETLVKKQMHIFLTAEGDLKVTAGRTLVLMKCGDENRFHRLIQILDADNINYSMIAAEILENMCVHCDKERVKETLLPKVLAKIMSWSEREKTQGDNSSLRNPEPGQDVENQDISTQEVNREIQKMPSPKDETKSSDQGNEQQLAIKALQAKLLSLTLVMYVKLESTDFGSALQNKDSAFVAKLKNMVAENCQATVGSLGIVKLCGQIAVSMLQRNQYTEHFKNKEFIKSLSKTREIMYNIESCLLFAGMNHELRKITRPLLLDLEKEARKVVG